MDKRYFNEDHEIFRKSVKNFVEKELAPHAQEWEEKEDFPTREVFKKVGDMGYFGIEFSTELGGSGLDFWYTVVFHEEFVQCGSGGVDMSVMVQKDITLPYIDKGGTEEQKKKFLVPGIKGDLIGALGVTEPFAGSDVAGIKTSAKKDGDYYVINGSKTFITNGCKADFVVLATKTNPSAGHQGITMFVVDTKTPGFMVSKRLKKLGHHTSDTAELAFDEMRVPKENIIGGENAGFYEIMKNFQRERIVAAIATVSGAQRIWNETKKYILERYAFGKPIGKFQVNQHKMVDMLTEITAARELTYLACWKFANNIDAVVDVSMAKLYSSEMANRVAYQCLQLYGGYGFMREYPIERAFRDFRLMPIGGGTSEIMKEIIRRLIGL